MIELLVLDVGNTTVTAAWMADGDVVARAVFPHADGLAALESFASTHPDRPAAIVAVNDAAMAKAVARLGDRRVLRAPTDFIAGAGNRCDPPESVGQDRIFNAAGVSRFPAVVIDAGTAITVDLVTADPSGSPVFCGGAIAPGVGLSFRALHEHTGRLPLVTPQGTASTGDVETSGCDASDRRLPSGAVSSRDVPSRGRNTEDAIRCGVVRGLAGLVDRLVRDVAIESGSSDEAHQAGAPAPTILLTGGDADLLRPYLGCETVMDPDLMLRGIAVSAGRAGVPK